MRVVMQQTRFIALSKVDWGVSLPEPLTWLMSNGNPYINNSQIIKY
jgi:hypothetical protein